MSTIGVVIPAYKESENLVRLCKAILATLPNARVLIIDDSPDQESVRLVRNERFTQVEIYHRDEKAGRGSAVLFGLSQLIPKNLQHYIEMDADFSHPPEQLPELIQFAEKHNVDLLVASRYMAASRITNWPPSRRLFSKLANKLAKFLLRVPVADYTNGYRLYSHRAAVEIVRSCGTRGSGFIALSEILVCLYYKHFSVAEVPTVFTNRVRGISSVSRKEIFYSLVGLKKIYFYRLQLMRESA